MTVQELTHRMSLGEYQGWVEFLTAEPPLSERVDLAGALISSVISNANRSKNSRPFSIEDFMVVRSVLQRRAARDEDPEANHLKVFVLSMGGSVS